MTVTVNETLGSTLDRADPNTISDAFHDVKMGTLLTPLQATITQASSATATLDPPALGPQHVYVRVTTGGATGVRTVVDAAETPSTTLATLSADGTTLTFEAAVTVFVLDYMPRSFTDLSTDFPTTGVG